MCRFPQMPEQPQEAGTRTVTRLDPRLVVQASGGDQLFLAALVPGLAATGGWARTGNGWAYVLHLAETEGTSWATCSALRGADQYEVHQGGDRHLWDETSAAYLTWLRMGRPDRSRFGMSITGGGQFVWLDDPDNVLLG